MTNRLESYESFRILDERNWAAEINGPGNLWAVGPEVEGSMSVLGMGPTLEEAVEMALKSVSETS